MDLEQALEHAAAGDGFLFLGAGFSVGATSVKNQSFKTGGALAKYLAARSSLPEETPLEDAAEIFAKQFGVDELIKELRREYTVRDISPAHQVIATLPWKRTYTTNYDNVFETAATQANKVVVPIGPDSRVHVTAKGDPLCIHLNGYIDNLNRDTIWNSFKLTDTSYATASIEKSEWAQLLRQDIRFARSAFFVGYSLFDLDIKRILKSTPDLIKKTFFILHDEVDPVTETRAERYGQVLKIATTGLAYKVKSDGYLLPRKPSALSIGRSIVEYEPHLITRSPTDKEFIDLIMLGDFNPSLSTSDPLTANLYNCDRNVTDEIIERLETNQIQTAAIHSNIANGKTVLLSLIAQTAVTKGWRVFFASELSEYAEREICSIAELSGKILLLIDDYVDWLPAIKGMTSIAGDRFAVVTTARSNSHDFAADELEDLLSPLKYEEYNLNTLTEDEIEWWVNIIDTYGLWGDLASQSKEQKSRFISDNCDRQLHGILLRLFDSPIIKQRLVNAASAIKIEPLAERIAITAFVLTILNQHPTIDTITDIWGVDIFDSDSVQCNKGLLSFIDVSRSSIRVRSTVSAEYLLNHFWQADTVVSILLEIAHAADKYYHISIKYENLFKTLMKFSSIVRILPEKGRREAVISYYENLKLFDRCKRFTLFWLQYAIGALVIGDLDRSKRYFDTSYSFAEKNKWDTYQIDNHYARYLLVRAAEKAPLDEAFILFREARTLINRQIKNEKLHYPYRVASSYQQFFDRFRSNFSSSQLKEIAEAAQTILAQIEMLSSYRAANKHVRRCKTAMLYIKNTVEAKEPEEGMQ